MAISAEVWVAAGDMRGLLADKKVAVLLSAGGAYGTGDIFEGIVCLTPHVRTILGFLGCTGCSLCCGSTNHACECRYS